MQMITDKDIIGVLTRYVPCVKLEESDSGNWVLPGTVEQFQGLLKRPSLHGYHVNFASAVHLARRIVELETLLDRISRSGRV